jgi:hypothetical protein
MTREGDHEQYQSIDHDFAHIPADTNFCLKDPGPLNNKKDFDRLNNLTGSYFLRRLKFDAEVFKGL